MVTFGQALMEVLLDELLFGTGDRGSDIYADLDGAGLSSSLSIRLSVAFV